MNLETNVGVNLGVNLGANLRLRTIIAYHNKSKYCKTSAPCYQHGNKQHLPMTISTHYSYVDTNATPTHYTITQQQQHYNT